jgi:hypothetical protein
MRGQVDDPGIMNVYVTLRDNRGKLMKSEVADDHRVEQGYKLKK